jgi:hypothetical protein
MNNAVKRIKRIRAEIQSSWKFPANPEMTSVYYLWTRRKYSHNQEQCDNAARTINNFLIQEIHNIEQPETIRALKAMQIAYMDMLGIRVYGYGSGGSRPVL